MFHCHACQSPLTEQARRDGKCPACGSALAKVPQRTLKEPTSQPAPGLVADPDANVNKTVEFSPEQTLAQAPSTPQVTDPNKLGPNELGPVEMGPDASDPKTSEQEPPAELESPPAEKTEQKTVQLANNATVDFSNLPQEDLPSDSRSTLELPEGSPNKHSTQAGINDFTIDLGADGVSTNSDDELAIHMTSEWGVATAGATAGNINPTHTLQQNNSSTLAGRGSKISRSVRSRSLRPRSAKSTAADSLLITDAPDYELLETIGQGGMGVVYAAHQSSIARTVAVKMLRPDGDTGDQQRDKFISEAVVTGELDHPNIVPIYDLGSNDQGALFYSMKRVKGTPWDDVVKQKSLDENLSILLRVADAVAFAHASGVVHRDLKPENVMLGDFGEVLVMDWGLARVTSSFSNPDAVLPADSLGGTPAYMSPEMARGPLEKIDHTSDIYLLGAILYELIAQKAPHTGRDVMQCLMAAAQNKIEPLEDRQTTTGTLIGADELLAIALKAMATDQKDRYQSVVEFQNAIRTYQSHSESLVLTSSAQRNLNEARDSSDYQAYAKAMYGFQESLALWGENERAKKLLAETELSYATSAYERGDYDLAASLLADISTSSETFAEERAELSEAITAAQGELNARQRRLKSAKRLAVALLLAVIGVTTFAYFAIRTQRNEAIAQKAIAEEERANAIAAQQDEAKQRQIAVKESIEAKKQRRIADEKRAEANKQREIAFEARKAEEYEAYIARIGLIAAKINENAYTRAEELLEECPQRFRNWEWGRLDYLSDLSSQIFEHAARIDAIAYSPDGKQILSTDWAGNAVVRDAKSGRTLLKIERPSPIHAAQFSPAGDRILLGQSDSTIALVDAKTGDEVRRFEGHAEGVLCVDFSLDGSRIASGGYDNMVRIWATDSGKMLDELEGHNWWVQKVRFSPRGDSLISVSQDGKALVWTQRDGKYAITNRFAAHDGPVYALAFSPSGQRVATGGYDKSIWIWNPNTAASLDLGQQIDGKAATAPTDAVRLVGHKDAVRDLDFSSDGSQLVSASDDNTLRLWDVRSATGLKTLRGHGGRVRTCEFSASDAEVASAGEDKTLRIWELSQYEELRQLSVRNPQGLQASKTVYRGHEDAILSAAFSQTGDQIVLGSRDRTASLWSTATGERLNTFAEGHDYLASSAVMYGKGQRLVTAAGDNTTRIWDVAAGVQLHTLPATGRNAAVAVSPDGRRIVTGSSSFNALLWDANSGEQIRSLASHQAEISAIAFSPDGQSLATGDVKGLILLWIKVADDRAAEDWQLQHRLEGHSRSITSLEFSSNRRLLSASGDQTCGQWNTSTGKEDRERVLRHPSWVSDLALSADGELAITACEDGVIRLWLVDQARVVAQYTPKNGTYNSVDLSADGRTALLGSSSQQVVDQWKIPSLETLMAEAQPALNPPQNVLDLSNGSTVVWAASFASEDRLLTIGGNDAQLWDGETGQQLLSFSPHGAVAATAIAPDGKQLATGSWDHTVKLWDTATGQATAKLQGIHHAAINSVAYSPDGRWLLTASDDQRAILWDLDSQATKPRMLEGHLGAVKHACFSADGSRILTVSSDATAKVWDPSTGKCVITLQGHEEGLLAGAFSPDGKHLATASEDNKAIIWEAASRKAIAELAGHSASVTSISFSPDGSRVITGSQDRTAKIWNPMQGDEILSLDAHTEEVAAVMFSPTGDSALTASRDGTAILWMANPWNAGTSSVTATATSQQ